LHFFQQTTASINPYIIDLRNTLKKYLCPYLGQIDGESFLNKWRKNEAAA
jgi:hypothetical protein